MRFLLALLLTASAPALAQCVEPPAPPPLDGAAASEDQMRAAMADARSFIAQEGVFQDCVSQELTAARIQAAAENHPLDPAIEAGARARIAASQKAQDRVGMTSNAALTAYKNAHAN